MDLGAYAQIDDLEQIMKDNGIHIVDCCCAGKTRSGYISPIVIDPEILKKAVDNTVKLIDNNTRIVE